LLSGDSQSATMTGTAFTATVRLGPGMNTIVIKARNILGLVNSMKRTVIVATPAPDLAITDPAQDRAIAATGFLLKGTITDVLSPTTITITHDGQTYTPPVMNGTFEQQLSLPSNQQYAIVVTAEDQAQNRQSVRRNILHAAHTGDLDGNGIIDMTDVMLLSNHVNGIKLLPADILIQADVAPLGSDGQPKGDGLVNLDDLHALTIRMMMGHW